MNDTETLPPGLVEKILERLGLSRLPAQDAQGLRQVYAPWCRKVPFDNVRKLIHIRQRLAGGLPGDSAEDFFAAWLAYGTGGTCWAGNGALHALLSALGFSAHRAASTMLSAPNLPPNHGTVLVDLEGVTHVVDASIMHHAPLPLVAGETAAIEHPAWGARCFEHNGSWHIGFRPLHMPAGLDCRIDHAPVSGGDFHQFHEQTRGWSPFNYGAYARVIRGETVIGIAFGQWIEFDGKGGVSQRALTGQERNQVLVEELGIAEAIVQALPEDIPTPPPPGAQPG